MSTVTNKVIYRNGRYRVVSQFFAIKDAYEALRVIGTGDLESVSIALDVMHPTHTATEADKLELVDTFNFMNLREI